MKIRKALGCIVIGTLVAAFPAAHASDGCDEVKGRVTSEIVAVFSDGEACPSLLGLCTEGRFTGDLKGKFRFVASTLTPFVALDPTSPLDVAATTGTLDLDVKRYCKGSLSFADTSSFSLGPDGSFAAIDTIVGTSGECADASGRIRIEGIFMNGCVDCNYRGEVCGVDNDDDERQRCQCRMLYGLLLVEQLGRPERRVLDRLTCVDGLANLAVVATDVAHAERRHQRITPIHLGDTPAQ